MICDFCSSPDVRWRYPARDHDCWAVLSLDEENNLESKTARSVGAWAACEECSKLIEAGDKAGLLRRSVETCERDPLDPEKKITAIVIADIHAGFWANRTGPRYEEKGGERVEKNSL